MELCQLVYCLLSRSRRVSSLPNINAWEEYMDVSKLFQYDEIPTAEFLQNFDFGAMLREFKESEGRDFQDRCREFINRFGAKCQLCHVRRFHHHLLWVLLSLHLLRRHIYIAVLAHYWVGRRALELS